MVGPCFTFSRNGEVRGLSLVQDETICNTAYAVLSTEHKENQAHIEIMFRSQLEVSVIFQAQVPPISLQSLWHLNNQKIVVIICIS